MKRRYHDRRAVVIAALGGKCVRCGSIHRLEIDHIDRTTKSFDLGHNWSTAHANYLAEIAKCQLLCHDCHKSKSSAEMGVPHGGGVSGKRNCPCEPCRQRKREYMRNHKRKARS